MSSSISTLGQQINLISRMKDIQGNMANYQQQVTTGVKHTNFADYGVDALKIQRYRTSLQDLQSYGYNIDAAQVNIQQMSDSLAENMKQAQNILSAVSLQLDKGSDFDLTTVQQAAHTALQIVESNMNTKVGGRYLLAGTDVESKPFTGGTGADTNINQRVSDWIDGTVDTDTFLAGLDGMSDSESGFSGSLQSAKNVYARADDNYEVDYTVLANSDGMKKVANGLRALTQLQFPNGTSDVATKDDFYKALDHIYASIQSGIDGLRADSSKLGNAASVLSGISTNHQNDTQNLQQVLENTEAVDTTDAIVKFQALQTQLEASYNITSIVSQLSLARFLSGG